MLRVLVVGGFDESDAASLPNLREFAQCLGKEVIHQGHVLLNACRTSFDAARISGKPVLPVARFGGAAEKIYAEELAAFDTRYGGRLSRDQFEDLAQLTSAPAEFAKTVVALAERVQRRERCWS